MDLGIILIILIILVSVIILLVVDVVAYGYFIMRATNKNGERFWDKHPDLFKMTMVVPFSFIYLLYRYIKFRKEK